MNHDDRLKSGMIMGSGFLLSLTVIGVVMAVNQVTPFGSQNLLIGDMGAQYAPFLTGLRHILTTGNFSWFSFSVGIGENIFPLVAYYLLSPFNFLVTLVSASQVPTAITWILMLKIATISLTMSFYLLRHFHRASWMIPFLGLAFSLCGFVSADFINIMWLDGLIYLPLICHGIDQVKAGHRPHQLFAWLTIAIISNYYIGYMIGIFTVIYTFMLLIWDKSPKVSGSQMITTNRPFLKQVGITEFFSILTAMVVLLPAALGMLQTAKAVPTVANRFIDNFKPQFGLEILSQIGMGSTGYTNRIYHAPAIFSSIVVAILFVSYFMHPRISHQKKIGTWFAFGLLLISMLVGPLNVAWHMFNEPFGSPFRYSFLVSFVMIIAAYDTWLANPIHLPRFAKWLAPTIVSAALIIGFIVIRIGTVTSRNAYLSLQPNSLKVLAVNLGTVLVLSLLMFLGHRQFATMTIGGLMMLEIGGNLSYAIRSDPLGNQSTYARSYNAEAAQLSSATNSQTSLYRLNVTDDKLSASILEYLGYNDPVAFSFNGIQEYSSTLHEQTRQSLKELGFFSKNERRIDNAGVTAASEMLLGVKYNLSAASGVQSNPTYVGMGFPVTTNFINFKLKPGNLFPNLNSVLRRLNPTPNSYLLPDKIQQRSISHSTIPGLVHADYTITPVQSGPIYLTTQSSTFRVSFITVNGRQISLIPNKLHKKYIVKLGTVAASKPVHIVIGGASPRTLQGLQIRRLNVSSLLQTANHLRAEAFQPTYHGDVLQGTLRRSTISQRWAYIAVPDDPGWSATVDNRPVTIRKVLGNFMAVPLSRTTNHIALTYHVPGLSTGIELSIVGLLGYGLFSMVAIKPGKHTKRKGRD